MKILVTGGTGLIGSHLVDALARRGDQVVAISRHAHRLPDHVEHRALDVADAAAPERIGLADAIVHLAGAADASASNAAPLLYNRTNALGTLNMLEAARRANALFVFASTQRVYRSQLVPVAEDAPRQPIDPYGYSKLVGEQWVQMYHELFQLRTTVLRFFSVYGPGQVSSSGVSGVVTIFLNRALHGEPLRVNDGNLRDFTHVGDVVRGITLALDAPAANGRTYNIATGTATTIETLARVVKDVTASPSAITVAGTECKEGYVADISRARAELGYAPAIDLRRGLELYVEQLEEMR